MRGHSVLAVLLVLASVCASAEHTGYWKQRTPAGASTACRLVETQEHLLTALREVGWQMTSVPTINWQDDCAIIISPPNHVQGATMAFYAISWNGKQFVLDWGRILMQSSVQTAVSSRSLGQASLPAWDKIHSSMSDPGPETIVVSFKHYMHDPNQLVCSQRPDPTPSQTGRSETSGSGVGGSITEGKSPGKSITQGAPSERDR
jgi:hypothetical protein